MIGPAARQALEHALGASVRFDADGSRLTSLRVGGPVDALAVPEDRGALARLLRTCTEHDLPCRPIGRGFNLLIDDAGVDGVLLQLSRFKRLETCPGGVLAEAGVSHATLTSFCRERGLAGLEFGAGIPGSLGGWIAMNAGIGEREVRDVVLEIEVFGPDGSGPATRGRDSLDFAYRRLVNLEPGAVVTAARFATTPSTPAEVAATVDALLAKRQATQPLDVPSCGSVFKNPPGDHAGRLIEASGLKGLEEGAARISTRHANFIVNAGGAKASDVLRLIERARDAVYRATGIELETEVRILGRGGAPRKETS